MIKETDGDKFEEMRSLEQELSFKAVTKEFESRNIDFRNQLVGFYWELIRKILW